MRGLPTIVIRSTLDFNYPYAQRVQHLARALARAGAAVIYVSPAHGHDSALTAVLAEPRLVVTPHMSAALHIASAPAVILISTDGAIPESFPSEVKKRGGRVVYDYIDHFDDAVSSHALSANQRALHRRLLADDDVVVLASATALVADAQRGRRAPVHLITNGVEEERFRAARRSADVLRADFGAIVAQGRPIVGYFGSFASWFDYGLIKEVARARPEIAFVLIGPALDASAAALADAPENLHLLSAMRYEDLPSHAAWFDAGLLPFVINDITLATSPLKIFEYMALGIATVSTDLPECRQYRSVLIAAGRDEFIASVDRALVLGRDEAFRALAHDEGGQNNWDRKATALLAALAPPSQEVIST
jgi:glycosyltransferase involved in cell wall biosynthesis